MEDERQRTIELLSELRSEYSCFNEAEEPYYRALSSAIAAVREQISENKKMTREELINFGEMFLEVNKDLKRNSGTYEFIDAAVKLFKQAPCEMATDTIASIREQISAANGRRVRAESEDEE